MRLKESFLLDPPLSLKDQYSLFTRKFRAFLRTADPNTATLEYLERGDLAITVHIIPMGIERTLVHSCAVQIGEPWVGGKYQAYRRQRALKFDLAVSQVGDILAEPVDMLPVIGDEVFSLLQTLDYVEPNPTKSRLDYLEFV